MIFEKLIKSQEECNLWDDMVEVSTKNEKINASQEKIWAYMFLSSCNNKRITKLMEEMDNNYARLGFKSNKIYPKTLSEAVSLASNYRNNATEGQKNKSNVTKAANFAQGKGKTKKKEKMWNAIIATRKDILLLSVQRRNVSQNSRVMLTQECWMSHKRMSVWRQVM